ncbi:MAG: HPr family phosphocarrier protein [Clostridia bacterium]|nr:HPr family phosphocarrier protein [Eubacteriales bacterium]MDD3866472.1 HPr family phosphocarrier protein [Eubacteriales bacterium]MDD4460962.1 HPr family phosphocarrier protein [Eubacteriales bacterium]NCC49434.1 HPr family phosphocarrier protein [Clostridia bacterium]
MVSKTVLFNCDEALQMKAVAVLIQKASTFRSSIWLYSGERRANAKSLLGVMSLGIENAKDLKVTAEGTDEEDALKTIAAYLEKPEF